MTTPMIASTPIEFSPAQRILFQSYDGGEFAHVLELTSRDAVMEALQDDGQLRFLFVELDPQEDCADLDDAEDRLDLAIRQLQAVHQALCAAPR